MTHIWRAGYEISIILKYIVAQAVQVKNLLKYSSFNVQNAEYLIVYVTGVS